MLKASKKNAVREKKSHHHSPSDDGSLCLSSSSIFMSFRALNYLALSLFNRRVTSTLQLTIFTVYYAGLFLTKLQNTE